MVTIQVPSCVLHVVVTDGAALTPKTANLRKSARIAALLHPRLALLKSQGAGGLLGEGENILIYYHELVVLYLLQASRPHPAISGVKCG